MSRAQETSKDAQCNAAMNSLLNPYDLLWDYQNLLLGTFEDSATIIGKKMTAGEYLGYKGLLAIADGRDSMDDSLVQCIGERHRCFVKLDQVPSVIADGYLPDRDQLPHAIVMLYNVLVENNYFRRYDVSKIYHPWICLDCKSIAVGLANGKCKCNNDLFSKCTHAFCRGARSVGKHCTRHFSDFSNSYADLLDHLDFSCLHRFYNPKKQCFESADQNKATMPRRKSELATTVCPDYQNEDVQMISSLQGSLEKMKRVLAASENVDAEPSAKKRRIEASMPGEESAKLYDELMRLAALLRPSSLENPVPSVEETDARQEDCADVASSGSSEGNESDWAPMEEETQSKEDHMESSVVANPLENNYLAYENTDNETTVDLPQSNNILLQSPSSNNPNMMENNNMNDPYDGDLSVVSGLLQMLPEFNHLTISLTDNWGNVFQHQHNTYSGDGAQPSIFMVCHSDIYYYYILQSVYNGTEVIQLVGDESMLTPKNNVRLMENEYWGFVATETGFKRIRFYLFDDEGAQRLCAINSPICPNEYDSFSNYSPEINFVDFNKAFNYDSELPLQMD